VRCNFFGGGGGFGAAASETSADVGTSGSDAAVAGRRRTRFNGSTLSATFCQSARSSSLSARFRRPADIRDPISASA
jgi:hypothetical protein